MIKTFCIIMMVLASFVFGMLFGKYEMREVPETKETGIEIIDVKRKEEPQDVVYFTISPLGYVKMYYSAKKVEKKIRKTSYLLDVWSYNKKTNELKELKVIQSLNIKETK